jgi:hypothetical protein
MAAFTYPRSEPGSAGHLDLVERLNGFPPVLRAELAGVPDASATRRPAGGGWSIKQVCAHMCDASHKLHERLWKIINLEEPRLPAYDEQELLAQRNLDAVPLAALLDEFSAQRAATVEMLTELVHWNWARTGRHEEYGRISIRQYVDRAIVHDATHVQQIRSLKSQ